MTDEPSGSANQRLSRAVSRTWHLLLIALAFAAVALAVALTVRNAHLISGSPWAYRLSYSREIAQIQAMDRQVSSQLAVGDCPAQERALEATLREEWPHAYLECRARGYRVGVQLGFDDDIHLDRCGDVVRWSFDADGSFAESVEPAS
jgi:hypothetical protein